jgi:peptidoglycan/xylan/chitin deacetylase (PgdA/CDA1 family)
MSALDLRLAGVLRRNTPCPSDPTTTPPANTLLATTPTPSPPTTTPANTPTTNAPPATTPATTPVANPATTTPGGVPPVVTPPATTYTFSLAATNPTAVPLTQIVSNETPSATIPLATTYSPGSQPTYLPSAPPLPNAALLSPANYPALDLPPSITSPEVQQWIQDVKNSGVNIPGYAPTLPGGCPNNTAAATDSSRCWWTCGGCTRSSDVTDCPTSMDWGLTYDDGPAFYTSNLLNYLNDHQLKSTFFVVGSRVISFPSILQAEYMAGHQIAVHTWSHPPLTTMTNEQIIAELGWSKKVIKDVLGVTPNMMRPPYGDIDDRVRAISLAMGLTPVMWSRISPLATFDTGDFYIHSGITSSQEVLYNWENIVGNATGRSTGFIVLEHDLFEQSVEIATGYILPDALAHKPPFSIKPVITCLNKPLKDAYIETNDNSTNPPPASSGAVATLSSGAPGSATTTGTTKSSAFSSGNALDSLGLAFLAAAGGSIMSFL